jgi:hypothetical protein
MTNQGGMMAKKKESKANSEADQKAQDSARTKIIWDDANMRSTYANAANVAGGREEIVLLFGMNQAWHAAQKEIKVQLSDRIILSPFAAKRLAMLLNNVLKDYEKRYGALDTQSQRPETGTT